MFTPATSAMLALPLLVPAVLADYVYATLAPDDPTLRAPLFYRCRNFHLFNPVPSSGPIGAATFGLLPESIGDPAPGQIVRRQHNQYPVTRQNPDEVLANFSRDVCVHLVTVGQFYLERRITQRLLDEPFDLYCVCLFLPLILFYSPGCQLRHIGVRRPKGPS